MPTASAAVFHGQDADSAVTIEDIHVDDPADNEVLVRTAACGVCHSDLHYMQGSIAGPPEVVAAWIRGFIDVGCTHVCVRIGCADVDGQLDKLHAMLPELRA